MCPPAGGARVARCRSLAWATKAGNEKREAGRNGKSAKEATFPEGNRSTRANVVRNRKRRRAFRAIVSRFPLPASRFVMVPLQSSVVTGAATQPHLSPNSSSMPNDTPNPRDDPADWEAIARYVAGECTPDQAAAVQRWLEAHPSEAAALSELNAAPALLASATPADLDVEAALRRVSERRDAAAVIPIADRLAARIMAPRVAVPARRWQSIALPAAAAAVVPIGGGLWWHSRGTPGYTPASVAQVFATNVGRRDSVRLADGTRVLLAPESRLTVAMGYGNTMREVELTGEAYFDVRHDAGRPFVVHAGGADIRDLGTT